MFCKCYVIGKKLGIGNYVFYVNNCNCCFWGVNVQKVCIFVNGKLKCVYVSICVLKVGKVICV